MYKNSRIQYKGTMSSAAANSTLAARLNVNTLPNVPKVQMSFAAGQPGGNRVAEIYLASSGEIESFTCRIYQAKEVAGSAGQILGYVVSPICSVAATCDSDADGILGDAANAEELFVCNEYVVTVSTDATTPKGIGATIQSAYGGGIVAFSPTDGHDARIIISDVGNADWLLFDIYGGSAIPRYVFVEGGV